MSPTIEKNIVCSLSLPHSLSLSVTVSVSLSLALSITFSMLVHECVRVCRKSVSVFVDGVKKKKTLKKRGERANRALSCLCMYVCVTFVCTNVCK